MKKKYILYSLLLSVLVLTSSACSNPEEPTPEKQVPSSSNEATSNQEQYLEAIKLYEADKLDEARKLFEEGMKQDSANGMYDYYIGNILRKQKDYQNAMTHYQSAIKKSPNIIEAYNNLVALQMAAQDFETALETANSGLNQQNDFKDLKFKKAQILYVMKQFEESNTILMELTQDELYYDAHRFLGLNYINLNDVEKAKEHLNKYLELAPDGIEAKEKVKEVLTQLENK